MYKCFGESCGAIIPEVFPISDGTCITCPRCKRINYRDQAKDRYSKCAPKGTVAPEGGMKFDGGKPQWTLLMRGCHAALAGVVAVLTFGAKKYSADSWKQVENGEIRYRDALYRHLSAIEGGEFVDPESGLPHWDHIACNAMFLSQKYHEAK